MTQTELDLAPKPTRYRELFEAWIDFHRANPQVWVLFCEYAREAHHAGAKRISADLICHRIRWNQEVERGNRAFKLNNNFCSFYARAFKVVCPMLGDLFETRRQTSRKHEPRGRADAPSPGSTAAFRGQNLELVLACFQNRRVRTHHNPACDPPWLALDMDAACLMIEAEGHQISPKAQQHLADLMADYCVLLEDAGLVAYGKTELEAVHSATAAADHRKQP